MNDSLLQSGSVAARRELRYRHGSIKAATKEEYQSCWGRVDWAQFIQFSRFCSALEGSYLSLWLGFQTDDLKAYLTLGTLCCETAKRLVNRSMMVNHE